MARSQAGKGQCAAGGEPDGDKKKSYPNPAAAVGQQELAGGKGGGKDQFGIHGDKSEEGHGHRNVMVSSPQAGPVAKEVDYPPGIWFLPPPGEPINVKEASSRKPAIKKLVRKLDVKEKLKKSVRRLDFKEKLDRMARLQ